MNPTVEAVRPTQDDFMTLFLCGLVVKRKTEIWIRGEPANAERKRMYAVHHFLNAQCDAKENQKDRDYLHFLLRLRNELSPGLIGSFDGFRHMILRKATTIVSLTLPFCETYDITVGETTARWQLEHSEPRMRALVDGAVAAYMGKIPK